MDDNAQTQAEGTEPQERAEVRLDSLRYSPRSIKELEDKAKKTIYEMVGQRNASYITLMVQYGLYTLQDGRRKPLPEDTAFDVIEEWMEATGKDMMQLEKFIIDTMERQGFLGRELELSKKFSDSIQATKKAGKLLESLATSGELESLLQ